MTILCGKANKVSLVVVSIYKSTSERFTIFCQHKTILKFKGLGEALGLTSILEAKVSFF